MLRPKAFIAAVGARSSIGLDALQTALLFRAGACGMRQAPILDDRGEPVTMCFLPTLDPFSVGSERAAALARPALEEALAPLAGKIDGRAVQLRLCLEADGREAATALAAQIQTRAHELLPGIGLEVTARGGASGAMAAAEALKALGARRLEAVVVGGVHCDYEPDKIRALSAQGRLFKPDNLDAYIPGEAAAFAVLMREDAMRRAGLEPMAAVIASESGFEAATPDNDLSAFDAKGLTATIRAATQELADSGLTAGWALTDLTFEMRRVAEWQAMLIRTRKVWSEPYVVESPAQRIGQLGAAAIPLGLCLAAVGWRVGSAPAPIAVVFGGSDAGERGATLLATP